MEEKNENIETLVSEIEQLVEAKLPQNLIHYITNNSSKPMDKRGFVRVVDEHFNQALLFISVMDFKRVKEAWEALYPDDDMINLKMVPFIEGHGSPIVCMSLLPNQYGSIYVFDYDFGPTKVAASLEEFLSRLTD